MSLFYILKTFEKHFFYNLFFSSNFYYRIPTCDANGEMDTKFKILSTQENDIIRPKTFTHLGRDLNFSRTCGRILDSQFDELCDRVSVFVITFYIKLFRI